MPTRHKKYLILLAAVLVSACVVRAPIATVPDGAVEAETVDVFVATNRESFLSTPERGRSEDIRHFLYSVRVPPDRVPGKLTLPGATVDAGKDFLAQSAIEYPSQPAFSRAVRRKLARLQPDDRGIVVYIHGFNTSFAEGVMRLAQLDHDLNLPGTAVHFSWPSAASPLGYAYDRDSALYSRDALEDFLRSLQKDSERILLVAHSMGAHLAMESLRQIEIASPGWSKKNISGVVLVSPDIDLDVFRQQAARIGGLPQPFVIFVSERDHALDLSARITGNDDRLGTLTDQDTIADLAITVLDVSDFSSGLGHFNVGDSPALIQILRHLARFDSSFQNEGSGRTGLVPGTVLTVQGVTDIILSPLSAIEER